jgi:hypothetical protein
MNATVEKKGGILDRAVKMSKTQLQEEVDRRLNGILCGDISGNELEKIKSEAVALATMLLRRG